MYVEANSLVDLAIELNFNGKQHRFHQSVNTQSHTYFFFQLILFEIGKTHTHSHIHTSIETKQMNEKKVNNDTIIGDS